MTAERQHCYKQRFNFGIRDSRGRLIGAIATAYFVDRTKRGRVASPDRAAFVEVYVQSTRELVPYGSSSHVYVTVAPDAVGEEVQRRLRNMVARYLKTGTYDGSRRDLLAREWEIECQW